MKHIKTYQLFENSNQPITDVINQLIVEYYDEFQTTPYQINDGLCIEFAADVIDKMSGYKDNLFELSDDMIFAHTDPDFAKENWTGGLIETEYGVWSKIMLDMYGYPPIPLEEVTHSGSHIWVYYNGKHYDAEAPEGVNNWTDLPIFKKLFESIKIK